MHDFADCIHNAVGINANHGHNILMQADRREFILMAQFLECAALAKIRQSRSATWLPRPLITL